MSIDNGIMKQLVKLGLLLMISACAQAASFDCAKAQTKVEKIICKPFSSSSKLDDELSIAYQWAVLRAKDPQQVKKDQRQWLKAVRDACEDEVCLWRVYPQRIAALEAQAETGGCYNMKPVVNDNKLQLVEPVCEALEKNLNRFCDQPPMVCGLKVAPDFHDQIILPSWTPLDPEANRDLIEAFVRAPWEGSSNKNAANEMWEIERPRVEKAFAEKHISFSRANLDLFNVGQSQAAYRLEYGDCEANNPLLHKSAFWKELKIHNEEVKVHQAPEVVRALFQQYFPLQREALNDVFLYDGKVYDYAMGSGRKPDRSTDDLETVEKNNVWQMWLGVGRRERWINPGNNKVRLSMSNICSFSYRPLPEQEQDKAKE
jgi:uncharacterized protein